MLTLLFQMNVHWWDQAEPPWVLPTYVGEFSWELTVNKTWIENDGPAGPAGSVTVEATAITLPMLPRPQATIEGESEVRTSDMEPPSS